MREYFYNADEEPEFESQFGIRLHPPLTLSRGAYFCEPLGYYPMGRSECNCQEFFLETCLQVSLNEVVLGFNYQAEHILSSTTVRLPLRVSSEKCRLKLYRKCWKGVCSIPEMYHNIRDEEGKNKRIALPNCACAIIRHLYPSKEGRYTGFKPN